MKRTMLGFAILLFAPFAQAAGYDLQSLRQALIDDPVRVEFQGAAEASKEKFRQAVQFIGASKGWTIANEADGRMELTRTVRGQHFVKVELTYDPRGYRVRYLESTNLLYEERKRFGASLRLIHKNYNNWIADLVSGISAGAGVPGKTLIGFAQFEDADAVPFLRERGREAYKDFMTRSVPRAFAIAPTGAFGAAAQPPQASYRSGIFDVIELAMERCNSRANGACRLYALDNRVVWNEPEAR
jgi:hypothetical protein